MRTYIPSLHSCDKLWFPHFQIFSFLLYLLISSSLSQITRSSLLLSTPFTFVICPSITLRRMQFIPVICPIQLTFICKILFRCVIFSPILSRISLVTLYHHFIFYILFQHHISQLSKYFHFNFLSAIQFNAPTKHLNNIFVSSMFSLIVSVFFLRRMLVQP